MQRVFLKMKIYILILISPRVRSDHLQLLGVICHWKPSEAIKEKNSYILETSFYMDMPTN
jgi:hypothetical protein